MLSNFDEHADGLTSAGLFQTSKKRKIQRACDICRRKKMRCDAVQTPEYPCSNCISCRSNCTFVEVAKKRGPSKAYVQKLEKLLRQLCPDETLLKELYTSLDGNGTIEPPHVGDSANKAPPNDALETAASAIRGAIEVNPESNRSSTDPHDDEDPTLSLADDLEKMAFTPNSVRFHGKSSDAMLLRTAIEFRNDHTDAENPKPALKQDFSAIKPWPERKSDETPTASPKYNFPDFDLALHCINLYFKFSNLYLPLLHRPTFDKCVREGLYLSNESFASVFLLVCAVGARHSDNPRVLPDGVDTYHSAGWKWFEQVQIVKSSLLSPPGLYDLQLYCLYVQYLMGSSTPHSCWTVAGIGIRLAQDVGAHRRKVHNHTHTPEDELWKRAFWVLVCMDRMTSSSMGRSCAIQYEDFDLDLPVDCDDEYWDNPDPEKRFKQPPNKPSSVTAFILYLKLQQILAFSLRTIYSINKSEILLGLVGQPWEQHVVSELDSALNKWVESVPDHLRWNPNREDITFFNQSVTLFATYYHIQITIHRPFISSPSKPSPLSFPSLAICTNAARSCSHVVDIHRRRTANPPALIQMPVFTSGVVLLLSIWSVKSSGLSTNPNEEMAAVHKCMNVLKTLEARWYSAGRLWGVISELTRKGGLPLPQPSREQDDPLSTSVSESPLSPQRRLPQPQAAPQLSATSTSNFDPPPQQAPSRHSQIRQNCESEQSTSTLSNAAPPVFALPVYSDELGRFPLHQQVTSTTQVHHLRPQIQSPQMHSTTKHWYTIPDSAIFEGGERSEPTFHADSTGAGLSYWPHYPPPPPAPRQEQRHTPHPTHDFPSIQQNVLSSTSEMFSMAHAPYVYGMDAAQMVTNMMLDSSDLSSAAAGLSSAGPPPLQSSSGSSMENLSNMGILRGGSGGHPFYRHQAAPQEQRQAPLTYPFVADGDPVEIWSNVPAGFGWGDWATYLASLGESMQGQGQHHDLIQDPLYTPA